MRRACTVARDSQPFAGGGPDRVADESCGMLDSQVPEALLGEALHTPILRHKLLLPLGMKDRLQ